MDFKMRDEFRPRRETPWPLRLPFDTKGRPTGAILDPAGLISVDTPETDLVALMECDPYSEPSESLESRAALRDLLADTIEEVLGPPQESRVSWVFHAHTFDGLSLLDIHRQLGWSKSQVGRDLIAARQALRNALENNPLIQERLHGDPE